MTLVLVTGRVLWCSLPPCALSGKAGQMFDSAFLPSFKSDTLVQ